MRDSTLLLPQLISSFRKILCMLGKLNTLLLQSGLEAFHEDHTFPMASEMSQQLSNVEDEDIIPEHRTRVDAAANPGNDYSDFHGYLLTRSVEDTLTSCYDEVISIVTDLKEALETCLSPLLENVFKSISLILDPSSYQHTTIDSLIADLDVVKQHFNDMLTANNCNTINLNLEFEVLHNHLTIFLPHHSLERC